MFQVVLCVGLGFLLEVLQYCKHESHMIRSSFQCVLSCSNPVNSYVTHS